MSFNYINATGIIVPDTDAILIDVQNEWTDPTVFGSSLSVSPNTPQGMFITSEANARLQDLQIAASTANQINPNLSSGIFLNSICSLTGLEREGYTFSIATITLSGVALENITAGTTIQSEIDLSQWVIITPTTLDDDGNGSAAFQCTVPGEISAPIGTLTQIVTAPAGLETVTNDTAATVGVTIQSDQSLRITRNATLFLQGQSLAGAEISGVSKVPGVLPYPTFRENVLTTSRTIDGVVMLPNSIYMCVSGGDNLAVATMIYNRKSGGCNYTNGASMINVSQDVTDPTSGQVQTILFDRPDLIPILVQVYVNNNSFITNITSVVQNAILDYVNGLQEGNAGLVVGVSVSSFALAAAVNIEVPGLLITNLLITLASAIDFETTEIPIDVWQQATISQSSIAVIIA